MYVNMEKDNNARVWRVPGEGISIHQYGKHSFSLHAAEETSHHNTMQEACNRVCDLLQLRRMTQDNAAVNAPSYMEARA